MCSVQTSRQCLYDQFQSLSDSLDKNEVVKTDNNLSRFPLCPRIIISLFSVPILALIDTGSQITTISEELYQYLSLHGKVTELPLSNVSIYAAIGKSSTNIKKQIFYDFMIGENKISSCFLVVPKLSAQIILGNDWLLRNDSVIDYKTRSIVINETIVPQNVIRFESSLSDDLFVTESPDGIDYIQTINLNRNLDKDSVFKNNKRNDQSSKKLECDFNNKTIVDLNSNLVDNLFVDSCELVADNCAVQKNDFDIFDRGDNCMFDNLFVSDDLYQTNGWNDALYQNLVGDRHCLCNGLVVCDGSHRINEDQNMSLRFNVNDNELGNHSCQSFDDRRTQNLNFENNENLFDLINGSNFENILKESPGNIFKKSLIYDDNRDNLIFGGLNFIDVDSNYQGDTYSNYVQELRSIISDVPEISETERDDFVIKMSKFERLFTPKYDSADTFCNDR